MTAEKAPTPAYGSFKSLTTFFNARREDEHITTVVDRSLLHKFNGSTANELLATLKFLKFINEKGIPTKLYEEYVRADETARKGLLAGVLREAYPFIFANDGFNVERETSGRMAEVFRAQGVNGSTLSRAISFFLSAAKEAGIKVSTNIKPPTLARPAKPKKSTVQASVQPDEVEEESEVDEDAVPEGMQAFEIPIPINRKVRILIPQDWSHDDWDLLQTMLKIYVDGWKRQDQKSRATKEPEAPSGT